MEKVEVSKQFILDLHNEVIWPSVKTKIEKEFPQLFEVKQTEMTLEQRVANLEEQLKQLK